MNLLNRLRVTRIFFQLVKDPNRTPLIFKAVKIFSKDGDPETIHRIETTAFSHRAFKAMFAENYVPEAPSLQYLSQLSEGSFGKVLHKHLIDNNLDLTLFPRLQANRPINYLTQRIYQEHDLWHVLFGYGVNLEDELALQAFGVAQFNSPVATMIIAGGLLHFLRSEPTRAVDALKKVAEGYDRGRKAQFLLSLRLHDMLPLPLAEVRRRCGVDRLIQSNEFPPLPIQA